MKNWKKLFGAALALALALAPVGMSYAESENTPPAVGGSFGGLHPNLDFYGVKKCVITDSTTAVLCKSGEGFFDAICVDGGLATGYSLALDSGQAGALAVTDALVQGYKLSPMVFSVSDTVTLASMPSLCFSAKNDVGGPIKFVNGLVGVQSASGHSSILYWHYSNGLNP